MTTSRDSHEKGASMWHAVVDERKPSGERHYWNTTVEADDALDAVKQVLSGYDEEHVCGIEVERV